MAGGGAAGGGPARGGGGGGPRAGGPARRGAGGPPPGGMHDHRMSDEPITEIPEVVSGPGSVEVPEQAPGESVEQPAKGMRIGSMIRQLLEEVRQAPLDDASRMRLKEIYETSVRELGEGLSPDL